MADLNDDLKKEGGKKTETTFEPEKMTSEDLEKFIENNPNVKSFFDSRVGKGVENFKESQAAIDKEASEKKALEEKAAKLQKAQSEMPDYLKPLLDEVKSLKETISNQSEKKRIEEKAKELKIPSQFIPLIKSLDQVDDFATAFSDAKETVIKDANGGKVINPENQKKESVKLTSDEEKMAKESGQTPEEYAMWRDNPSKALEEMQKKKE